MKLHELSPAEGSVKARFRKGRGAGSGNGKTAGKGQSSPCLCKADSPCHHIPNSLNQPLHSVQ